MNERNKVKKHWTFWLICLFGLIWNAGGAANYLMQTSMEFVKSMPDTHQAIIIGRPVWATGGFAVGVFGGVIGCVLLMLGRRLSLRVFYMSLAGIVLTMIHTINVAITVIDFSLGELVMMVVLPVLVAIALIVYTNSTLNSFGN